MVEQILEQEPLFSGIGPARIAVSISGTGSNLIKLYERQDKNIQEGRVPWEIGMVLSDNSIDSKAVQICKEHGTLLVYNDLAAFCAKRGCDIKSKDARWDYDCQNVKHYLAEGIDMLVQAGYEWYTTEPVFGRILTINVHPGDLTKLGSDGKRLYRGLYHKPAEKAIKNREKFIRSSVHIVNSEIDGGAVLTLSNALPIQLPDGFDYNDPRQLEREAKRHQNMLKEIGDWVALPFTVDAYGFKDLTKDARGNYFYKGVQCPVRLGVAI